VIDGSSYPDVAKWVDFFIRNPVSDAEAIRVFGPRDGRASATPASS
jgi:hypothetical protein